MTIRSACGIAVGDHVVAWRYCASSVKARVASVASCASAHGQTAPGVPCPGTVHAWHRPWSSGTCEGGKTIDNAGQRGDGGDRACPVVSDHDSHDSPEYVLRTGAA